MFLLSHKRSLSSLNGFLLKNPLLVSGCFAALAAVPVVTLKCGVSLTVLLTLVAIPTFVCFSLLSGFLHGMLKTVAAPLLAALFYIPAWYVTEACFPGMSERFGFYLALVVLDTFFLARCPALAGHRKLLWVCTDAFSCCLGLGVIFTVTGLIRELFGTGTLWGVRCLGDLPVFSALVTPFGGFFVLAFLMAFLNLLANVLRWVLRRAENAERMEAEPR